MTKRWPARRAVPASSQRCWAPQQLAHRGGTPEHSESGSHHTFSSSSIQWHEAHIVIGRAKKFPSVPSDDSLRTRTRHARGRVNVLSVVPSRLLRQKPFLILDYRAVILV